MTNKSETFYTRLEAFRKQEGLTQDGAALKLGITRNAYAKIGDNPTLSRIVAILDAFPNLSLQWLVTGEGYMCKSQNQPEEPSVEPTDIPQSPFKLEESFATNSVLENFIQRQIDKGVKDELEKTALRNKIKVLTEQLQLKSDLS